ncbi:uncharacterized protein LOC120338037 [Styela clava]
MNSFIFRSMMNFSNVLTVGIFLAYIFISSNSASAASISAPSTTEHDTLNKTESTEAITTAIPVTKQTRFSKFAMSCGNWKNACKMSKNKNNYQMTCAKAVKKLKFLKGPKDFKTKINFCYGCRKYVCKGGSIVG